jgi:hypothetical protein
LRATAAPPEDALLNLPFGIEWRDGVLLISDTGNNVHPSGQACDDRASPSRRRRGLALAAPSHRRLQRRRRRR